MLFANSKVDDYGTDFKLSRALNFGIEKDVMGFDVLVPNGIWLLAVKVDEAAQTLSHNTRPGV